MPNGATPHPHRPPRWQGRPIYGYDLPVIQNRYIEREVTSVADFFLSHLRAGMSLLDCGCGPGALTLGLAKAVTPGPVIGIDLEPRMIARAIATATAQQIGNTCFQVANICALPFADHSFDALFTSAVLEHLSDPGQALEEFYRVLKPGGSIGVIHTDWGEPLIAPPDDAVQQFFALFERGFNHHGGSLNRGRHLRRMMRQAGFVVTDFSASFINATTPEAIRRSVSGYVEWIDHLPLFEEAIALGWVDRRALDDMGAQMRRWSEHPDAFLALGRCTALGRKEEA